MAEPQHAKAVRQYAVLGTLNLGRKPQKNPKDLPEYDVRQPGETITDEELFAAGVTAEDIRDLVFKKQLADPDEAVRPSQAEGYVALEVLAKLAERVGVLTRRGLQYRVDDTTYKNVIEFRKAVTIDQLSNLIADAFKRA